MEGSSGNTGASVAMVASSMGLKSILYVPDKCSDEKIAIIKSYGAEVIVKPASAPVDSDDEYGNAAKKRAKESSDFYHIDQYKDVDFERFLEELQRALIIISAKDIEFHKEFKRFFFSFIDVPNQNL